MTEATTTLTRTDFDRAENFAEQASTTRNKGCSILRSAGGAIRGGRRVVPPRHECDALRSAFGGGTPEGSIAERDLPEFALRTAQPIVRAQNFLHARMR